MELGINQHLSRMRQGEMLLHLHLLPHGHDRKGFYTSIPFSRVMQEGLRHLYSGRLRRGVHTQQPPLKDAQEGILSQHLH